MKARYEGVVSIVRLRGVVSIVSLKGQVFRRCQYCKYFKFERQGMKAL